jgi:hypothetical protein
VAVDDVVLTPTLVMTVPSVSYYAAFPGVRPDPFGEILVLRSAGLDDQATSEAVPAAVLLEMCNRVINDLEVKSAGLLQNRDGFTQSSLFRDLSLDPPANFG